MNLLLVNVASARARVKSAPAEQMFSDFVDRAGRFTPCTALTLDSETALLALLDRQASRTRPVLILLDSRGKELSSPEFAAQLARLRDSGTQTVMLAIGPADGWSPAARARANLILSFGPITLPHLLARVVLAEQVYRALTILAGHPYHSGH